MKNTCKTLLALLLCAALLLCCGCSGEEASTPSGSSGEDGYRPVSNVEANWDVTQSVDESFDFEQYKADEHVLDCPWRELYGSINIVQINDSTIAPEYAEEIPVWRGALTVFRTIIDEILWRKPPRGIAL